MSEASAFRGEPFNPYGLHAIRVPLAMITYDGLTKARPRLSVGAKLLYGRLALFLGKPKTTSFCSPDLNTMSKAMNVSQDTVGRWLAELIDHGFIERVRRSRGPAECRFLPHPCFEPGKDGSDSATLRSQSDDLELSRFRNLAVPIPQICGSDSATLRSRIKEEDVHENVQENVQHHPDDDAAPSSPKTSPNGKTPGQRSAFVDAVEAASGLRFSRSDLVYCAELERGGVDAEVACAGVLISRRNWVDNNQKRGLRGELPTPAPRSLRFFSEEIEAVAKGGFDPVYVAYLRGAFSNLDSKPSIPESSDVQYSQRSA